MHSEPPPAKCPSLAISYKLMSATCGRSASCVWVSTTGFEYLLCEECWRRLMDKATKGNGR